MKIHGLCLVKNEADVIAECLRAACSWCDHIYVLDNGSTDRTWDLVRELAVELPQIIPWKQDDAPFHNGLRGEIYCAFSDRATSEDWWCRLDADEFYVEDPQVFLRKIPARYGIVWYATLSFYFSTADAEAYQRDPSLFSDSVPVSQKCRYYHNHWSEIRFVRHRDIGSWPPSHNGWPPDLIGRVHSCPIRILAKHYPYRSPAQIERRIATRALPALRGHGFKHETIANWSMIVDPKAIQQHKWRDIAYVTDAALFAHGWESRVIKAEGLNYDAHDNRYVLNEDLMPPIPEIRPSSQPRALFNRVKRIAKSVKSRLV